MMLVNRVSYVKDLGIWLDAKLNFKYHINVVVAKANQVLGLVKRFSKEFNDVYVCKNLYCSLIRPILEYGNSVWMPLFSVDCNRIESVQKQFLLFCLRNLGWRDAYVLPPYEHRLNLLNMATLRNRQKLMCCMFIYDLLQGHTTADAIREQIIFRDNIQDLRNHRPLYELNCTTQYGAHEPINRCIRIFNEHYHLYSQASSRISFKNYVLLALKDA